MPKPSDRLTLYRKRCAHGPREASRKTNSVIFLTLYVTLNACTDDVFRCCFVGNVQKDPAEEGRLHEHTAHQQPAQVQEGQGDLPAGRVPDAM